MQVSLVDAQTGERITAPSDWVPQHPATMRVLELGADAEIRDLDPHDLRVDPAYQRPLSRRRAHAYAKAWNPIRAFPLTVSQRGARDYVVIDGQHRLAAALEAGVSTVGCLVLRGLTRRQEAGLFADLTEYRVPLTARDRFRARLEEGDPLYAHIAQAVTECGYTLYLQPGTPQDAHKLVAVGTLVTLYRRGLYLKPHTRTALPIHPEDGMASIKRVLISIDRCFPNQRDGIQHDMLMGMHTFWLYYADQVTLDALAEKLRLMTATQIVREAVGRRQTLGGSRPLWVAHAIRDAYNKRRTTLRLPASLPTPGSKEDTEATRG